MGLNREGRGGLINSMQPTIKNKSGVIEMCDIV